MSRIRYLMYIFVLAVNIKANDDDRNYVFMRVYYESRCPDSRDFVIQQLQPTIAKLHEYIDLELIPFGKAHSLMNRTFECQHGPWECMGNKVQACALDLMVGRLTTVEIVNYVSCELATEAGTRNELLCVKNSGTNPEMVSDCASGSLGIDLLLRNEQMTKQIRPQNIPTVTFDGIYDQQVQYLSLVNLMRTVCSYFNYSVRPCKRRLKKYEKIYRNKMKEENNKP